MMSNFTKITSFIASIILSSYATLNAQTDTFFVETMGTGTGNNNVSAHTFDNEANGVTYSTNNTLNNLRTSSASGVYSFASGGYNLFYPVRSTSGANGAITFTIDNIDISSHEDVQLLFGIRKSNSEATPANMTITAAVDNGTPINMAYTYAATGNNNTWFSVLSTTTIPNGSTLRLTFTRSGSANTSSEYRLDDISLLGTPIPLPLDLIRFEAKNSSLVWETAKEVNVSHFEVEYSSDANTFQSYNTVQAFNNLWNTKYETEIPTFSETRYYRLKMIDLDGTFKYSKIVMVKGNNTLKQSITFYPNPNTDGQFYTENNVIVKEINIYSVTGQHVSKYSNTNNFYFNPDTKGMYFIEIQNEYNQKNYQKVIIK